MQPPSALARRLDRLLNRLSTRSFQLGVLSAATVLAATSVGPHEALDDYILGLIARGRGGPVGLSRGTLDLFTFTTGDPESNRRLIDVGVMLPWWTDQHLRIAFFRPLSSFTHWVDEQLFPSSAVLMHLHSLLWFAIFLGAVLWLYRRLETSASLAGLAFYFYAMDDAHATALSWIANRNALIAGTFGCVTLVAHDAFTRHGDRRASANAVISWVLALLSGESAVGMFAYLAAYAAFIDERRARDRVLSLSPYAVLVFLWRLGWGRGFGAKGSGAYIDPLSDPVDFLGVLPGKLAVLLHGQFSAPPADVAFLGPPSHQRLVLALATITVVVVGWLLLPLIRSDKVSRFWASGMLLSALPLASTFPSDRLLLFVGIGAMALVARLVQGVVASMNEGRAWTSPRSALTLGLAGLHGVVAPVLLPIRAAQMELFGVAHDRAAMDIPANQAITDRTVVVVAAPVVLFANYIQAEREYQGIPRPKHLYVLSDASSPLEITRSGPMRLTIHPREGFLYTPLERHYRAAPLPEGTEVRLSAMTARVVRARSDGRPDAVEFEFEGPPEDYLFVIWKDGHYVPFDLPQEAQSSSVPEEDFGKILLSTALHPSPEGPPSGVGSRK